MQNCFEQNPVAVARRMGTDVGGHNDAAQSPQPVFTILYLSIIALGVDSQEQNSSASKGLTKLCKALMYIPQRRLDSPNKQQKPI